MFVNTLEKHVTAEALKYINGRHIDEIFQGQNISFKIILEHKLKMWQNENVSNYNKLFSSNDFN